MVSRSPTAQLAIIAWSVIGVLAILIDAIVRVLPLALEPLLDGSVDAVGVAAYVAAIASLAYFEGYRGFQGRFSPRLVVRALAVAKHGRWWLVALSPLMVMGLLHATRRRLIASWALVAMIVSLIVLVRLLDQPWRGAVDAGVVVGLSWGAIATLALTIQALRGHVPQVDPDLPT